MYEWPASSAWAWHSWAITTITKLLPCNCFSRWLISRLLKTIASDVSDVVRRNAVFALGFVYIHHPEEFNETALLLLQSYNPYIRYATAVISGFINAGSANTKLATAMLKLMEEKV